MATSRKKIWEEIRLEVEKLAYDIKRQNFLIDIAYRLFNKYSESLAYRPDKLNVAVLSVYWAKQVLRIWEVNEFKLEASRVYIEEEYYSYLDLIEVSNESERLGWRVDLIDFIAETTPLKTGTELGEWLSDNDLFQDSMKDLWSTTLLDEWLATGMLVPRKSSTNFENYWRYENIIYMLRILDEDLNPIQISLLGTWDDYRPPAKE